MNWSLFYIFISLLVGAHSLVAADRGAIDLSITTGQTKIDSSVQDDSSKEWCQTIFRETVPHYKQLFRHLSNPRAVPANIPVLDLLRAKNEDCETEEGRLRIRRALSMHSRRIALILPHAPHPQQNFSSSVITGFRHYFRQVDAEFERHVIMLNSNGSHSQVLLQRIAEAVYIHSATILVGGASRSDAVLLDEWSQKLQIPTLILHQNHSPATSSQYSFHISPDSHQIVQAIIQLIRNRQLGRIAFLMPGNRTDVILDQLRHRLNQMPGVGFQTYHYRQQDFASMEGAARRLFRIDSPERQEELEKLVKLKKEEAEALGLSFDPRTIMLPARKEYDAIFIADHFKNVRHFVSIFKFLNAPKVDLIGNQQWRAPELLHPPEPYLNGAIFFDYIGSYRYLPLNRQVPLQESEFFTYPELSQSLDVEIIAQVAAQIADAAMKDSQIRRFRMHEFVSGLKQQDSKFFNQDLVFTPYQSTFWPTFFFRIASDRLELLSPHSPYR